MSLFLLICIALYTFSDVHGEEYSKCAEEGGTCECVGTVYYASRNLHVRFLRANPRLYSSKVSYGSIKCTDNAFGEDPWPFQKKQCTCIPGVFEEHWVSKRSFCHGDVYYGQSGRPRTVEFIKRKNYVRRRTNGHFECTDEFFGVGKFDFLSANNKFPRFKMCICDPLSEELPPSTPEDSRPGKCSTGSAYTEKMIAALEPASKYMALCNEDVVNVRDKVSLIESRARSVESVLETLSEVTTSMDNFISVVVDNPPMGFGIAEAIGMIPKIGVFIKMGLESASEVLEKTDALVNRFLQITRRINRVIELTSGGFDVTSRLTNPIDVFLSRSQSILEDAHEAATETGYRCQTPAGDMELANERFLPKAETTLEVTAKVGEVCHRAMNPIDNILDEIFEAVSRVDALLDPVRRLGDRVGEFIEVMDDLIDDFTEELLKNEVAQCALEIIEPVADVIDLVQCPIDATISAAVRIVIDALNDQFEEVVVRAADDLIRRGLEAVLPEDFSIEIPDLTECLPPFKVFFEVAGVSTEVPQINNRPCSTLNPFACFPSAVPDDFRPRTPFTVLEDAFDALSRTDFPLKITFDDIRVNIVQEAWQLIPKPERGNFVDVCIDAFKDLIQEPEFQNCLDVSCAVAKEANAANQVALEAAEEAFDDASDALRVAQGALADAQEAVDDEKKKFDDANRVLEDEKRNCDFGCKCKLSAPWCCAFDNAARAVCRAVLTASQGVVTASRSTLDAAIFVVEGADLTLKGVEITFTETADAVDDLRGAIGGLLEDIEKSCSPESGLRVRS